MAEAWAPGLDDCARLIPTRTRDTKTPGSDALLGTFTASTTPDAGQAQAAIDAAVLAVLSQTGPLDPLDGDLLDQARNAAAWRAAADIELAYPDRAADVQVADQLNTRAQYELTLLLRRLAAQGEGEGGAETSVPAWSAPAPPPYADRDPGDYGSMSAGWWGGIDRGAL